MKARDLLRTYLNNDDHITSIQIECDSGYILLLKTNEFNNVKIPKTNKSKPHLVNNLVDFEVKSWWVDINIKRVYIYVKRNDDIV